MQRFPCLSITDALGLAPPREEPGASKSFMSSKFSLSSSIFSAAANNFFISTNGGTGSEFFVVKNSPLAASLNLKAPCLVKSFTPSKYSISFSVLDARPSSFASLDSYLRIKIRPQVSGAESPNAPNIFIPCLVACFPLPKNKLGSRENDSFLANHSFAYSNVDVSLPFLKCDHISPTKKSSPFIFIYTNTFLSAIINHQLSCLLMFHSHQAKLSHHPKGQPSAAFSHAYSLSR